MRVTTAFSRLLRLPGAAVIDVSFSGEGVIVTVWLRCRRRVCAGCGQTGRLEIHDRRLKRWRHLDLGANRCVERVPIRSCQRRGVAIDLVLDRPQENRSQLVFTRIQGGREGIFWQTARTTRQARPGIRVPRRLAAGLTELTILVDSRERYPYKFS